MSTFLILLVALLIVAIPIMAVVLLIRFLMKKSCKKFGIVVLICVGSILPLTILAFLTDPVTWCDHEYSIIEEVAATCTEKGKIVKQCSLCKTETVDNLDKLPHSWGAYTTVDATCTQQGYTKRICSNCSAEDVNPIEKLAHQWTEKSSVAATCTEKGEIVKKCSACAAEDVEYTNTIPHSWEVDRVVDATCTSAGYTVEKCPVCSSTQKTNSTAALGHNMKETSRVAPTYESAGKIVKKCDRCSYEVVTTIPKLEPIVIKFDGLELSFGTYSFTEVDNKYSEYYNKPIVKIPVTVTNTSKTPNSLSIIYYKLFSASGAESADVSYYFNEDDVGYAGDLLPGKSYTKYFHFLYDGDGVYTIYFDDWLFEKETVEIYVTK